MTISLKYQLRKSNKLLVMCKNQYSSSLESLKLNVESSNSNIITLFYNDVYEVVLPDKHRFPMFKYRLVREGLQSEYQNKVNFLISPLATRSELIKTHCPNYVDRYLNNNLLEKENRKIGFPWSIAHVNRTLSSVGGTIAAMRAVLSSSNSLVSCHIAGGTHHAFYDYGEGFCIFSDIAVAANLALEEFNRKQILIIDLDVHQGNGNAVLFQNNSQVFTFSIHCKDNYFSDIQKSDIDVELPSGTCDDEYNETLRRWLDYLIPFVKPDLIFYQAGVDIYKDDRLGKLNITRKGLQLRNEIVYRKIKENNIKLVVTMGGGYPKDLTPDSESFINIVEAHKDVYRQCIDIFK